MSLIEQRKQFMSQLQTLIDSRQNDINEKVAARRAQVEAEYVQPYQAELEKEKVTPEMNKLVEFIGNIDEMLEYETSGVAADVETDYEQAEDEQAEDEARVEEAVNDDSTFQTDANINTKTVDECAENASIANERIGTGLDAVAADIADTNKKFQSVVESRPGMSGIVLPRR